MTRLCLPARRRPAPFLALAVPVALSLLALSCSPPPSPLAAAGTPPPATALPATAMTAASRTPAPRPTATPVPTLPPATATSSPTPVPAATFPPDLAATMRQIEAEIEAIRGLEMSVPLTQTVKSRAELAEYMADEFAEDYPPEEVATDTRVLAILDLVRDDLDLRQVLLDLYSEQVLGMYDDEENSFIVVNDDEFDLLDRMTYAHEYVHGLQDEHFDLTSFIDEDLLSDDEVLARLALVEGDATLAMSAYFLAQAGQASPAELQALTEEPPDEQDALDAAPPILRETLTFPYTYGTEFVNAVASGSWAQVNALFADPPLSTEQILHPEKYLAREEPQILSLPPLTGTLGAGWTRIEDNVLGEFQLGIYLGEKLDGATAAAAGAGWGGDRYAVYVHGDDEILALATAWDSAAEQEEFARAYEAWATAKYGGEARHDGAVLWWESAGQVTALLAQDQRAVIVVGSDPETASRALQALAGLLIEQEQEA